MPNATLEIARLFADRKAPSDVTGGLTTIAELLESIDPCLFLLADQNGEVIAADDAGSGTNLRRVRRAGTVHGRTAPRRGPE